MSFLKKLENIDWWIIAALLVLSAFSLSFLFNYNYSFFKRQILWYFISFVIILLSFKIKWEVIIKSPVLIYIFYFFCIVLLFISNLQSELIRGTKSWLSIGNFSIEPAEFTKLAIILVLSNFFSKSYLAAWRTKYLLISLAFVLLPISLIIIHPDLGSSVIIFGLWAVFVFFGGINKKRFVIGLFIFILIAVLGWFFLLKDYQKARITAFLFPNKDPLGINYNVIQSKIAVGNGGWWGNGLGGGTQTHFNFLPEAHADFIFSALAEEWGFIGVSVLLLTFFLIFYRMLDIALMARSNTFKFVVLGAEVLLALQIFVNIGSNLGILPVTGLTLPFVSYGGSSLLTFAILFSIIQRIKIVL